jgi:hypothetical protein
MKFPWATADPAGQEWGLQAFRRRQIALFRLRKEPASIFLQNLPPLQTSRSLFV